MITLEVKEGRKMLHKIRVHPLGHPSLGEYKVITKRDVYFVVQDPSKLILELMQKILEIEVLKERLNGKAKI